jgi:hypothetical protein
MDPLVKILKVADSTGFDLQTLQPLRDKVVTYMVGTHGPFTLRYHLSEYTEQRVSEDIQNEVNILRGIGALEAGS